MTALVNSRAESANRVEEPFKPLFTIRRSGRIEVTVYGIVSVVTGANGTAASPFERLMSAGDTAFELWSRSLLKPWQLLTNFQILKKNYPGLTDEHYALFMASHSGEEVHIKALEEILKITGVDESFLKCPPASPVDRHTKELMKERGEEPRRRYHNCSGKHSGYLAAVKASLGQDKMNDYLQETEAQHSRLKNILSAITGRSSETFVATTDGCQLPNYALSPDEMAYAYLTLLNKEALPQTAKEQDIFRPYAELGRLMLTHPRLISGKGRLDYKIMSREIFSDAPPMVAKEGADGLLGLAVAPNSQYPQGIGITIKLAAGFDSHHMELIAREILVALQLTTQTSKGERRGEPRPASATKNSGAGVRTDHIKSEFHFLDNFAGIKK